MTDERNHSAVSEDPEINRLYRSTRIEEPSSRLDAKILAEAEIVARRRRRRWLLPLSSAAVVLLGVSFTIKLMEQTPRLPDSMDSFDVGESTTAGEAPAVSPQAVKPQATLAPEKRREPMSRAVPQSLFSKQKRPPKQPLPESKVNASGLQFDQLERLDSDLSESAEPDVSNLPQEWLARIETLLDAGEIAGATAELRAFASAYPEYPLPERLQELLISP